MVCLRSASCVNADDTFISSITKSKNNNNCFNLPKKHLNYLIHNVDWLHFNFLGGTKSGLVLQALNTMSP